MPARVPGPIADFDGLLTILGEYRQLHLALADREPGPAWIAALDRPTELELDAVASLEASLGASFSDATLAVFASHVPHLEDHLRMNLEGLAELDHVARTLGCPPELLAIAYQGDGFACVPRREQAWTSTEVTVWRREDGPGPPQSLQRWLGNGPIAELWDLLVELEAIDPGDDEPLPPQARPDAAQQLTLRLVDARAPSGSVMRVQHAKFGVGRVLRAIGDGDGRKLEIDFGAAGVRTILARFVTELPTAVC